MRSDPTISLAFRSRNARAAVRSICALAVVLTAACSSGLRTDAEYWGWVEKKRAVGEYEARNFPGETIYDLYLRVYPSGDHVEQARKWLADYRWAEATRLGTRESYLRYRQRLDFPTEHDAEADYRASLLGLPSREGARACMANAGSAACGTLLEYRERYPETEKGREIAGWFAEYEREMAPQRARQDDLAYERALGESTYGAVSRYLEFYPQGRHLTEARAELGRYRWEALKVPWALPWRELGRPPPLSDDALTVRYGDALRRAGIVIEGCTTGKRLIGLGNWLIADAGARFAAGSPPVSVIAATLSATDVDGIALLEPDPGQCVVTLMTDEYYAVGSRFRILETLDAAGEARALSINGRLVRKGELSITPEGLRFETGSVVLRRAGP